jgi:hypothetical protein
VGVSARDPPALQPAGQADGQPVHRKLQLLGQFLIDRDGYIRWARTEDRTTYAMFPAADELVALAERAKDERV